MIKVLYIHGFNSSPGSAKAKIFRDYVSEVNPAIDVITPQIKTTPELAMAQLEDIVSSDVNAQWCFVGSSLGGYFSTYLAEKYQRPAVLVNPAVKPYELLSDYIGEQTNPYTQEIYHVTEEHMQQLKLLEVNKPLNRTLYYLLVQTEDEVLDYKQAVEKYADCRQVVQEGGDHSFIDFDKMMPDIVKFLQIA